MIDNKTAVNYATNLLSLEKIEPSDRDGYIGSAIKLAMVTLWSAWDWSFKFKDTTLSITTSVESYDLPDDFAGIRTIRERTTTSGARLFYLPKEEFDRLIPNQTVIAEGTPQYFTIFRDNENDIWKISFFPRPGSAMTLYIDYATVSLSNIDTLPEVAEPAFWACFKNELYPASHVGKNTAMIEKRTEIEELKKHDKVDASRFVVMLDESATPSVQSWTWLYGPWN